MDDWIATTQGLRRLEKKIERVRWMMRKGQMKKKRREKIGSNALAEGKNDLSLAVKKSFFVR
jgi:vacuolar-type H+-ATPase subunit E/Vma4